MWPVIINVSQYLITRISNNRKLKMYCIEILIRVIWYIQSKMFFNSHELLSNLFLSEIHFIKSSNNNCLLRHKKNLNIKYNPVLHSYFYGLFLA